LRGNPENSSKSDYEIDIALTVPGDYLSTFCTDSVQAG
jgi:hypothetical protein